MAAKNKHAHTQSHATGAFTENGHYKICLDKSSNDVFNEYDLFLPCSSYALPIVCSQAEWPTLLYAWQQNELPCQSFVAAHCAPCDAKSMAAQHINIQIAHFTKVDSIKGRLHDNFIHFIVTHNLARMGNSGFSRALSGWGFRFSHNWDLKFY